MPPALAPFSMNGFSSLYPRDTTSGIDSQLDTASESGSDVLMTDISDEDVLSFPDSAYAESLDKSTADRKEETQGTAADTESTSPQSSAEDLIDLSTSMNGDESLTQEHERRQPRKLEIRSGLRATTGSIENTLHLRRSNSVEYPPLPPARANGTSAANLDEKTKWKLKSEAEAKAQARKFDEKLERERAKWLKEKTKLENTIIHFQNQNNLQKDTVRAVQDDNLDLREKRKDDARRHKADLDRLCAEYNSAISRVKQNGIDDYNGLHAHASAEIKRIRTQAGNEIEKEKTYISSLHEDKEKMTATCKDLELQVESYERTIRQIQSAALKTVDPACYAPFSASDIEHRIKGLCSGIKIWSEKYTAELALESVLDENAWETITESLLKRGIITSAEKLCQGLCERKTMQKDGKAAALLLAAMVTCDIMAKIIPDPFFAFVGNEQQGDGEEVLKQADGEAVKNLIGLVRQSNEADAENFRCQLFRLLDPIEAAANRDIRAIASRSRKQAARYLAKALREEFCNTLLTTTSTDDDEEEANDSESALEALILSATELSWSLHIRKARIETFTWNQILARQTSGNQQLTYFAASDFMDPHPLHSAQLEDEPEALDGEEVLLLFCPAIVAVGNAEGTSYEKFRVLRKGVVWMG